MPDITNITSDETLFDQLTAELQRRLPFVVQEDYDLLVPAIRSLPRGLRAMASTHRLDVSMAMNDLGWHFFNFCDRPFNEEIVWGLRELEVVEVAEIFGLARGFVEPHWDEIGHLRANGRKAFADWYSKSDLKQTLNPLNSRLWAICELSKDYGLMQFWLDYARKYPDRLSENK